MKIEVMKTNTDYWLGRIRDALAGVGILACIAIAGYVVEVLR
jgi:hypothetical protein